MVEGIDDYLKRIEKATALMDLVDEAATDIGEKCVDWYRKGEIFLACCDDEQEKKKSAWAIILPMVRSVELALVLTTAIVEQIDDELARKVLLEISNLTDLQTDIVNTLERWTNEPRAAA